MEDAEVALEAERFARYLLRGPEPAPEAIDRYAEACARLFGADGSATDRAEVAFAVRHAWSLPFLDAAAGLLRPESLLRKKLFVMLAILETIPAHAGEFAPVASSPARVILRLAGWGLASACKAAGGLLLASVARRSRP